MTYSISAAGHIPSGTEEQTPDAIEAELALKLHAVFADPKYGVSNATLYGQYAGQVNLHAVADVPASEVAESGESVKDEPGPF